MEHQSMRILERYRLDDPVESGGFGTVFRGFDELLKRPVAVKILRDSAKGSPTLQSSLREARAASALNHPSIVTVHDVGEHEGRPFIVMEWVEGKTLRQILSGKRVDPVLVADCARQNGVRARGRQRGRPRAPGSEAGERRAAGRWNSQDPGFRALVHRHFSPR